MTDSFDSFVLSENRLGRDHLVLQKEGVAAVSEAFMGSANAWLADKCASAATDSIAQHFRGRPGCETSDWSAQLALAFQLANRRVRELNDKHADDSFMYATPVSMATVMDTDRGLLVAWAGPRTRVHRLRAGRWETLNPTPVELASKSEIARLPEGAVHSFPEECVVGDVKGEDWVFESSGMRSVWLIVSDLGLFPEAEAPYDEFCYPVQSGDLIVVSAGWGLVEDVNKSQGEEFLSGLSRQVEKPKSVSDGVVKNLDFKRHLPAVVIRFNHDSG